MEPLVTNIREPEIVLGLPWIVFVFGPTSVGKNTLADPLRLKGILNKIITATSRKRRPNEAENAYVWMREPKRNETKDQYTENLVKEYNLIEHNFHNNALYGIPLKNLENELTRGPVLLIVEVNGVKTISNLMQGRANLLKIFIMPESMDQIKRRVQGRGQEEERLSRAKEEIDEAPNIADFYITNKEGQIFKAREALENLVKRYILK